LSTLRHTPGPIRIAYRRQGAGPLVVFLHGIGGNSSNWLEQLEAFGRRFCAVAWDARGYGASDDPPGTLRFGDYADDLCRLLDHLAAEAAHLVGMSMGGMIIQDFYARYRDRVATLTLADTSVGLGAAAEEARRDFLARRLGPLEGGVSPRELAPHLLDVLMSPQAPSHLAERLRASLAALRPEPYKQALRAIVTTDFRAVLPDVRVPTLVVVGAEDRVTPPSLSETLAATIPGAEKVIIEGAGHLSNMERPEAFNAAVGGFLDRHAVRASTLGTG